MPRQTVSLQTQTERERGERGERGLESERDRRRRGKLGLGADLTALKPLERETPPKILARLAASVNRLSSPWIA